MVSAHLLVGCGGRDHVLYAAASDDGKYRAEVVTRHSAIADSYEAELRLFSMDPPVEVGRLGILGGRDEAEDITNEIRGMRWSKGVLQLEVVRHHLLFPDGIVTVNTSEHVSETTKGGK
jgi:hypothetical protein